MKQVQGTEAGCFCSSDDEYCYSLQCGSEEGPRPNVIINEESVQVLVDSAASVNVLDETTYMTAGKQKNVKEEFGKLFSVWRRKSLKTKGNATKLLNIQAYLLA